MIFICSLLACKSGNQEVSPSDYTAWQNYAGTKDGSRYSSLEEINLSNVQNLQVAWRYSSGDRDTLNRSQNQCNPIVVDGVLYGSSPRLKLLALNAATGEPQWVFDPAEEDSAHAQDPYRFYKVNRGLVYWQGDAKNESRIFYNVGARVYAISSTTGQPLREFGKGGYIELSEALDRDPGTFNPFIANTSPGIIYKDLIILGSRVAESADGAPGHVRAYNVITGKREWIFHTIPHPGEVGYDTWPDKEAYKKLGGANSWAGMSLDEERGIVYIPTGSVAGDFYGGIREGENLFANSLVALDAMTGKYIWHYQTVHHDLWDRDLAANPNLVTLRKEGKDLDAVAQITKHGYVFLFDRVSGEPVFPIEEKAVSQNALPGEKPWATQPVPTLPEPFARQEFNEEDVTNLTPEIHEEMVRRYRQIKFKEQFHPPSREGSWIFPGFDGGGEWGGAAVDPETQVLYVNSSELPWAMIMVDLPGDDLTSGAKSPGRSVYNKYCFACHGVDLKGNGTSFPSLLQIGSKYAADEIRNILKNGINMMPAFQQIPDRELDALIAFLRDDKKEGEPTVEQAKEPVTSEVSPKGSLLDEVPYRMAGYTRFLDDEGYPGITPPWGTLNAVDLNSGKLLWKVPLGEYPELTALGHPKTGTENYGGPAVTKGGLIFIAATKDSKIRAFDKKTGEEVWVADLPAPGYATPSVYSVNGKQYIVIACGGGKIGSISGDEYVAFALP